MSSPIPSPAQQVYEAIKGLTPTGLAWLLKTLDSEGFFAKVGRVLIPQLLFDRMNELIHGFQSLADRNLEMATQLAIAADRRKRKPDKTRLQRGMIIREANKSGISWKKMPIHIIGNYPDWFPDYGGSIPKGEHKKRLEESLRKMARDAAKHEQNSLAAALAKRIPAGG